MSEFLVEIEPIASAMREEFLGGVERRVVPFLRMPWSEVVPKVRELHGALRKSDAWRVRDRQGAPYFEVSCLLLALYRGLLDAFQDKGVLLGILGETLTKINFKDGMDAFLLARFGISPDTPEEAWDRLRANYIALGRERFGCGWVFEPGIQDQRRFFVNIRSCAFADFFLAHDAREVLYLLCASDYLWGDALEEKYGIRLERPTILAEGSDACRFQFLDVRQRK
jgi:hypothetical protein